MSFVKKEVNDQIAVLTINRPEALNAMNGEVVTDLEDAVLSCIGNPNIGVIILTGSGDKAFVAGADIKKMQTMDPERALAFGKAGQQMTLYIENSQKPIIAFNGVLNSWLILAKNSDFAEAAFSAFSFAKKSSLVLPLILLSKLD